MYTRKPKVKRYIKKKIKIVVKSYIGTIDNLNDKLENESPENLDLKAQLSAAMLALTISKGSKTDEDIKQDTSYLQQMYYLTENKYLENT